MVKPIMHIKQARGITEQAININPVEIQIKRKDYKDDGLGGKVSTGYITIPAQTIRIFFSSSKFQGKTDEGGTIEKALWGGLCLWDTDVIKDDTFTANGRSFKVASVIPVSIAGEVTSQQLELEEVK